VRTSTVDDVVAEDVGDDLDDTEVIDGLFNEEGLKCFDSIGLLNDDDDINDC